MVYPHRNLLLKISLGIIPLVQKNATKWLFLKFTDSGSSNIGPLDQQLEPFDCTSIPSHLSRWIQESVPIYTNTAQNPKKETRTQINHKWYSMWYAYIEKKYLFLFYSSKKCSMYVYNWMYIYIYEIAPPRKNSIMIMSFSSFLLSTTSSRVKTCSSEFSGPFVWHTSSLRTLLCWFASVADAPARGAALVPSGGRWRLRNTQRLHGQQCGWHFTGSWGKKYPHWSTGGEKMETLPTKKNTIQQPSQKINS